jgi:phage terminase large subunit GpA-like protein
MENNYSYYLDGLERRYMLSNMLDIIKAGNSILKPPSKEGIIEWAEANINFDETFAIPGPFRIKNVPHLREILELWTCPTVRNSAIMGCAQFGKTIALCVLWAYFVDKDPSSLLIMQPTDQEVKSFAEQKLERIIEASPILKKKVARKKRGDSAESSTRKKMYPGGWTEIISGTSRGRVRQRSVKRTFADDIDALKLTKDSEGSPITNLEKRTSSFKYDYLHINISTPRIEGESNIYVKTVAGSQGQYYIICSHCQEEIQFLDDEMYIESDKDLMGNPIKYNYESAKAVCPKCGVMYNEPERMHLLETTGHWKHKYEHLKYYYPSWLLPEIMSPLSNLVSVAKQKCEAELASANGDDSVLESHWNNCKGLPYPKTKGKATDAKQLLDKREDYMNSDSPGIPNGVMVITSMVDVQQGSASKPARLLFRAYGWGVGEEGWIVDKKIIPGNPAEPATWQKLEDYLETKKYVRKDGLEIPLEMRFFDSGYLPQPVYDFCAGRWRQGYYATKGANQYGAPLLPRKGTMVNNDKTMLIRIGTQAAKGELYARLNIVAEGRNSGTEKLFSKTAELNDGNFDNVLEGIAGLSNGSGRAAEKVKNILKEGEGRAKWLHFTKEFCDVEFYDELTAEHGVQKNSGIFSFMIYEKKVKSASNDELDLLVGSYCAMKSLNIKWDLLKENIDAQLEEMKGEIKEDKKTNEQQAGRQRRTEPRRMA